MSWADPQCRLTVLSCLSLLSFLDLLRVLAPVLSHRRIKGTVSSMEASTESLTTERSAKRQKRAAPLNEPEEDKEVVLAAVKKKGKAR